MWIYVNDRFVRKEEARISVFDHGFLYGDGIYETLRAYKGRIFMLRHHLARLRRSAGLIGLDMPIPESDWPALLQRNAGAKRAVRCLPPHYDLAGRRRDRTGSATLPRPTVVIIGLPLQSYPPQLFQDGVSLTVVSVRRNLSSALPPQIKSLNFLNNILAKQEAAQQGAFDGVMLNHQGHVTECTTSNKQYVS